METHVENMKTLLKFMRVCEVLHYEQMRIETNKFETRKKKCKDEIYFAKAYMHTHGHII